ncbi:MAG: hypothetical protein VW683_15270 [Betaproteobacteria bacterium]
MRARTCPTLHPYCNGTGKPRCLQIAGTNDASLAGKPYALPGILLGLPSDPMIACACFNVVIFIVLVLQPLFERLGVFVTCYTPYVALVTLYQLGRRVTLHQSLVMQEASYRSIRLEHFPFPFT